MMRSGMLRRAVLMPSPLTRTLSTSPLRFAAAATAVAPSPTTSTSRPAARGYVKKVATPTSSTSASTLRPRAASVTQLAPAKAPTPVADEISFDDFSGVEDHSLPDVTAGIEDYAALTPPSPAVVRRARTPSAVQEQPTPSPPMTSLPQGESTLPMAGARKAPDIAGEQYTGLGVGEAGELDWSTSFAGLGQRAFPKEVGEALLKPLAPADVEVKPGEPAHSSNNRYSSSFHIDGLLYLPEIKYRRTLNLAFGPGGWGLAPRGETNVGPRIVSREWGLIALGR